MNNSTQRAGLVNSDTKFFYRKYKGYYIHRYRGHSKFSLLADGRQQYKYMITLPDSTSILYYTPNRKAATNFINQHINV